MRPRIRQPGQPSQRVPLTYYRSGNSAKPNSPFDQRPVATGSRRGGRIIDFLLVLSLLVCLVLTLRINPSAKVTVSNDVYHSNQIYADAAKQKLSSFSSQNKITFDEVKLVNNLRSEFPEISSAQVELPIVGSVPKVYLIKIKSLLNL
jgi:hypothetical protein